MTEQQPVWVIMPILAAPTLTEAAIADVLAQSVPVRLLLINQGVDDGFRAHLEQIAESEPERVFLWSHQPPLPSLSATWNRALDFVWECGGECALVVNNDVRLDPRTVSILEAVLTWPKREALFVSAVGVTSEQFETRPEPLFSPPDGETPPQLDAAYDAAAYNALTKGGPDFSCFLISKACHERFRFDEAYIPCFVEDIDYHRRLMLAGEGQRIFSVNLPYLHYGSQTLKTLDPKAAAAIQTQIASVSRAHHLRKWGGSANAETFFSPFAKGTEYSTAGLPNPPTTTALFDRERTLWAKPSTS